jgi:hypothetical protein
MTEELQAKQSLVELRTEAGKEGGSATFWYYAIKAVVHALLSISRSIQSLDKS